MNVEAIFLPQALSQDAILNRAVVVFDVLRATTTIAAALTAGVEEVRVFAELSSAKDAAATHAGPKLLCGEYRCLPPPGFDLGNSPVAFDAHAHRGRTMFLSTTNGTRAFLAARDAKLLMAGAVVNASAVARILLQSELDVTLLCAGTDGKLALEDILGVGAVIDALTRLSEPTLESDAARLALSFFCDRRNTLAKTMSESQGGRNIRAVGLDGDITYAAKHDALDVVGVVQKSDANCLTLRANRLA